jgi:4-hydroxy-2,2'-bipyrrole-5-carbaldehyde O-methyltransferase
MKLSTAASLLRGGSLFLLLRCKSLFTPFYRLLFLASIADMPLMEQLSRGPVSLEDLETQFSGNPSLREAAETWLGLGVYLGLLKKNGKGYSLRGFLAKKLAAPGNDAVRALLRESAILHYQYIMGTPERLERGVLWDPAEVHARCGDIIARSSRSLEPFLVELIDRVFPTSGDVSLLEIGCGHAGYIIHAAAKNRGLTALGLELDRQVADMARGNIEAAGLRDRVEIRVEDVRRFHADGAFDVATLYNNIYYFPVEERVGLLAHLRGLLRPGGRLLLATGCLGGGIEFELVNLIHAATRGWGRIPGRNEMVRQLQEAGFERVSSRSLVPGDTYCAFIGRRPA